MDKEFNIINQFLAFHNYSKHQHYDLILVLGNALSIVAIEGYKLYLQGRADYFMIAGGRGHTIDILMEQLNTFDENMSEAEMLKHYIETLYGKDEKILLEVHSTNCGENIRFAFDVLETKGIEVKKVLLLHDPLMQRRIDATAKRYYPKVQFHNYASFQPQVNIENNRLILKNKQVWTMERYVSLLLGEMKRIIDDENGYGPNGKNYIEHVDIPQYVLEAYKKILLKYQIYVRE